MSNNSRTREQYQTKTRRRKKTKEQDIPGSPTVLSAGFAKLATPDELKEILASMRAFDDTPRKREFLLLYPAVCKLAGGGLTALVLQLIVYWVSVAQDGFPRARPQATYDELDNPFWTTPGLAGIARLLGLDDGENRAAEKRVGRALTRLENLKLVQRLQEAPCLQAKTNDGRKLRRLSVCLTPQAWEHLEQNGISWRSKPKSPVVKVWVSDVRNFGVNEAIVLGQIWYRVVVEPSRIRRKKTKAIPRWWRASFAQIGYETGLSEDQVREAITGRRAAEQGRARKGLVRPGLVVSRLHPNGCGKISAYTIRKAAQIHIERQRIEFRDDVQAII